MGDCNINLFDVKLKTKWNDKLCKPYFLKQMIQKTTRVWEKSTTLLDHIHTTRPTVVVEESDTIDCSLSDHNIIWCNQEGRSSNVQMSNVKTTFSGEQWTNLPYISASDEMLEKINTQFLFLNNRQKSCQVKSKKLLEIGWIKKFSLNQTLERT